ncbi:UBA/TS-N domain-containing protein [Diplocarpon rosae]|nr:UBA/TS-N domain-containing protein [Diplocarpon rosae]
MMASTLSKRQQARNERSLQDLIKSVPGNNLCADCQARNPGWASWSLGIFICMRCAALHRKLGTHITKVKSLSMDSWTNEQVENMKRVGNVASNRIYNPQNTRPPIPFDADEADSAMERFIRGKYVDRAAPMPTARNNTGSTNSDDQPPPLPPKPGSRFGFRSASSIFPLSSKSRKEAAARQDYDNNARQLSQSPPRNKQSRVFGAAVGAEGPDDLELKLQKLRNMGFRDDRRNTAVLKGLSGNLEKSIETLVRLGDGGGGTLNSPGVAGRQKTFSRSPVASPTGLTLNRTQKMPSPISSNPFDMLDTPPPVAPPQSSQSTGELPTPQVMGNNPYQPAQSSNPFGLAPSQSQYNLNQAFQNMSVQPSPPLFPNRTGGFPAAQPPPSQQLYQQNVTPAVPSVPQQYQQPVIYENLSQVQPQQNSYNPFMQQQPVQAPQLNLNTRSISNPYNQQLMTPQSLYQSPMEQKSPAQQYGSAFFGNGGAAPQQQHMNPFLGQNPPQQMNPFFNQQQAQQSPQQGLDYNYQYQGQRQQKYPQMPQKTLRADKKSIMDLYNYPQMAPTPARPIVQPEQSQSQAQPQSTAPRPQAAEQLQEVSAPLAAGNNNPFALSGSNAVQNSGDTLGTMGQFPPKQNGGSRHVSKESVDAGGWANGRHSPDAWGSISARSTR